MGKCRFEFQITLNRNGSGNSPIFNQGGEEKNNDEVKAKKPSLKNNKVKTQRICGVQEIKRCYTHTHTHTEAVCVCTYDDI
jgi:hypothetical protein